MGGRSGRAISAVVALLLLLGAAWPTAARASGGAPARGVQSFCVYSLLQGSTQTVAIVSMIRADFADLGSDNTYLESEIGTEQSNYQSIRATALALAARAPSSHLAAEFTDIARDVTSLAGLTGRLLAAVRADASDPSPAAHSSVTSIEDRYLAAAAVDQRDAPVSAEVRATNGLCLDYEHAEIEAQTVVFSALRRSGGVLTVTDLRAALNSPAYRGSAVLAATPAGHVDDVSLRIAGQRVCLVVSRSPSRASPVPCA